MSEQNKVVVRRWFEEVWNQGCEASIDELFPEGGVAHGLGDSEADVHGPAEFKLFAAHIRGSIPDVNIQRERACDEQVLQAGGNSEIYAEGILNVCRLYLRTPLVCISGIAGSDLKERIERIVAHRANHHLDCSRKLLLAALGIVATAGPVAIGMIHAPLARAQVQISERREFEVASVKANRSGRAGWDGFQMSHGSLTVKNVSLRTLIAASYGVQEARIAGGPGWLNSDRYDIAAKGAAGGNEQEVWLMLRSLLAERFKLQLRNETRELPIYSLEVGKDTSKLLKRNDGGCEAASTATASVRPCGDLARIWGPQGGQMFGERVSISAIVDTLSGIVNRPVIDHTALTGTFDVQLKWTPEDYKPRVGERPEGRPIDSGGPGPSIFTALQEQLGLKLTATKGPVEVLVIYHVERPSEN
ncbi:MAG TPA: TIGR03435 family protein [Candidatus Acidoferrum sp.]|nr:TIGR03435 family protein [Candidatus Acidoferrum sp.]